jgi:hypothetical protein
MKQVISSVLLLFGIMVVSCGINSLAMALGLMPKEQTGYIGMGVREPKPSDYAVVKRDEMYGDFGIKADPELARSPNGYVTRVTDGVPMTQPEFPPSW